MLRSMFSAVSGLRSHQTMMDVTGNNVANVNTAGYKATRTTFQETLTQIVRGGTAGVAGNQGGQNPMQLGLGAQVASTDLVYTQGASQVTGRPTDVAIQGDGFFVVEFGGANYFMRSGAFGLDNEGNLVAPGGEMVRGWMAPTPGPGAAIPAAGDETQLENLTIDPDDYTDISIGADGTITGRFAADGELHVIGQLAMARFPNPGGLVRAGNGLFADSPAAGGSIIDIPGQEGLGTLQSGTLEMSNVDLAQEFTNLILAQRGFQANARTITTSDELLQELVNLKR
jgi:flagellar hook protein FlgE